MNTTRRQFIQAAAAALVVPIVHLRKEVDRESLLAAFADPCPGSRYDIDSPFVYDSLTYATDARHICRAELSLPLEIGKKRVPPVDIVWSELWHPGKWQPFELPPIESLSHTTDYPICPYCNNRRVELGDEYQNYEWICSPEPERLDYDVDDNTIRDKSCAACHGQRYKGGTIAMIQGAPMCYSRLHAIAALPNVRVSASRLKERDHGCICFRADGFEGIAMGVDGRYVERVR